MAGACLLVADSAVGRSFFGLFHVSRLWRGVSRFCACAQVQHAHLQARHTHPLSKSAWLLISAQPGAGAAGMAPTWRAQGLPHQGLPEVPASELSPWFSEAQEQLRCQLSPPHRGWVLRAPPSAHASRSEALSLPAIFSLRSGRAHGSGLAPPGLLALGLSISLSPHPTLPLFAGHLARCSEAL